MWSPEIDDRRLKESLSEGAKLFSGLILLAWGTQQSWKCLQGSDWKLIDICQDTMSPTYVNGNEFPPFLLPTLYTFTRECLSDLPSSSYRFRISAE